MSVLMPQHCHVSYAAEVGMLTIIAQHSLACCVSQKVVSVQVAMSHAQLCEALHGSRAPARHPVYVALAEGGSRGPAAAQQGAEVWLQGQGLTVHQAQHKRVGCSNLAQHAAQIGVVQAARNGLQQGWHLVW